MIDHIWSVLCSRSVIDRDTNNVSLQNVLEQIIIHAEPRSGLVIPVEYEIVSFWARADPDVPAKGRMRAKMLTPAGEVHIQREFDLNLTDAERTRTRIRTIGLPASEPGRHYVIVEQQLEDNAEWRQVAAIPLAIGFGRPDQPSE